MGSSVKIGLAGYLLLGSCGAAWAQNTAVPNSDMAPPSGNSGAANNGIGHQGSLTRDAGSHSSTTTGPTAAARIPTNPAGSNRSGNAAKVESGATQGGSEKH